MSKTTLVIILLAVMSQMAQTTAWAADTVSVTLRVDTAGSLYSLIGGYANQMKTTHLKVSGYLNGTDIRFIREMAGSNVTGIKTYGKLSELDLSQATIVAGGSFYWSENLPSWANPKTYSTVENQIGTRMFDGCWILEKVILPANVSSIGDYAFMACSGMTSVHVSEGVNNIGAYAFSGCTKLSSFSIPNSVTTLGVSAFMDCLALTSIQIPESVTFDIVPAMTNCSKLAEFEVSANNPVFSSMDGILCSKDQRQVICFPAGRTNCSLPDTVTSIADNAFNGCKHLTSLTMQDNIYSIGAYAFKGCTGLTTVRIPAAVRILCDGIFMNCTSLTSISIPTEVTSIGYAAFNNCPLLSAVILPDSLISFGELAFVWCKGLLSMTIPTGVKSIPKGLFASCTGLTTINLPESLTAIDESAFQSCSSLVTITLPHHVNSVSDWCFWDCTGLRAIYCNAMTPPVATSKSFLNVLKDSCRLFIPTGSMNLYKQAAGWSAFLNMEEPSGWGKPVKAVTELRIVANGSHVQIKGIEIGEFISVYSILGVLIKRVEVVESTTHIFLPSHHCYLIRTKYQTSTISL